MKQIPCRTRGCAPGTGGGISTLLAGAALFGSALAQDLPMPELSITATPVSERITLEWAEVSREQGRRVSNVTYDDFWDFVHSSEVELVGEYVLECDYRLRIARLSEDLPPLQRRLVITAQIYENTEGIGAPLRVDSLTIVAPDSVHAFRPEFAPELGIRVSPNISAPSGPLGSIPVRLHGVSATSDTLAGYFATALNSVTSLSQGLQVQVTGPVDLQNIPDPLPSDHTTQLEVTSSTQVFPIMDGMRVSFGEGSAAPGDTVTWTAHYAFYPDGRVIADLEAFEGYHIWRSDLPNLAEFTLLGEIRQCESKSTLALIGNDEIDALDIELRYDPAARHFTLHDRDVHNDFPYRYGVSVFDRGFLGNNQNLTFEGPRAVTGRLYPAFPARSRDRGEVYVVPNPYKRASDFEEREPRVVFANLPTECTIRIFTEAADHLVTLRHGPGEPRSTSATSREWDLRSESGRRITPGVYVFYVEGTDRYEQEVAGGGTVTVNESVEQVGKMMVVR